MAESVKPRNKGWIIGIAIAAVLVTMGAIIGVASSGVPKAEDLAISESEMHDLCQVKSMADIEKALAGVHYVAVDDTIDATFQKWERKSRYGTPAFVYSWAGRDTDSGEWIAFACVASKNDKKDTEILSLTAMYADTEKMFTILGNVLTALDTTGEDGSVAPSEEWMIDACQKEHRRNIDEAFAGIEYDFIDTDGYHRRYSVYDNYYSSYGSPVTALTWYGNNTTDDLLMTFSCYAAKDSSGENRIFYLGADNGIVDHRNIIGTLRDAFDDESWNKLGE